ncbi:MAG: hypothetical protein ACOC56_00780 [Atribacterota bacterium]
MIKDGKITTETRIASEEDGEWCNINDILEFKDLLNEQPKISFNKNKEELNKSKENNGDSWSLLVGIFFVINGLVELRFISSYPAVAILVAGVLTSVGIGIIKYYKPAYFIAIPLLILLILRGATMSMENGADTMIMWPMAALYILLRKKGRNSFFGENKKEDF